MVNKLTHYFILEPFLTRLHDELHLAELSKLLGEPHVTVRLWLNELVSKGVLTRRTKGRLTLYSLRREQQNIIEYLTIAEKHKLIRRCEQDLVLREFVHVLVHNVRSMSVIFGSAAESAKANDIDLLLIGKADTSQFKDIAKRLNVGLHCVIIKRLDDVSAALKVEIGKKHLIIKGSEEVLRWLLSNGA